MTHENTTPPPTLETLQKLMHQALTPPDSQTSDAEVMRNQAQILDLIFRNLLHPSYMRYDAVGYSKGAMKAQNQFRTTIKALNSLNSPSSPPSKT